MHELAKSTSDLSADWLSIGNRFLGAFPEEYKFKFGLWMCGVCSIKKVNAIGNLVLYVRRKGRVIRL